MALYAKRCDAALASFMEKASARDRELEASAATRLNQFCGLPANGGLTDVDKHHGSTESGPSSKATLPSDNFPRIALNAPMVTVNLINGRS
jgi:hypothetical protein